MLATGTDDQLLRWKEVAENPRIDNYRTITTLRQLVVDLYNKSIKDIVDELSIAVNNEIDSRKEDIIMDKKLEARIANLEKLIGNKSVKNEDVDKSSENIKKIVECLAEANKYMQRCTVPSAEIDRELNFSEEMKIENYLMLIKVTCEQLQNDLLGY